MAMYRCWVWYGNDAHHVESLVDGERNGVSTTLERVTAALADRYRIDRELGAGGMAAVLGPVNRR